MTEIINTNYEHLTKIIEDDKKIKTVFKDIINNKASNKSADFKKFRDKDNYDFTIINKDSKLYQGQLWFYPEEYDLHSDNFLVYPYYYHDIATAAVFALYNCGGINSYVAKRDIKLLFVDQVFIKNIIKKFLNPILNKKNIKYREYYEYVKLYLKSEYNLATSTELNKIEKIHSNDISGNSWTCYFLTYISKILRYDGLIFLNNTGIYNIVTNSLKIILNKSALMIRNTNSRYDWTNWGINEYILPISEFDLNTTHYLHKNRGFKAYNFYRSSLQVSIKTSEDYDFATLHINNLISINKLHNKDICIKGLISFIKNHKLKFICLQGIQYKDIATFNKFITAENMYSSSGDFEKKYFKDNDLCNIVVSTGRIIILNNELLPGGKQHFILFKHPNYKGMKFLNTQLVDSKDNAKLRQKQLLVVKEAESQYILGNLNIVKGTTDYDILSSMGYALNSNEVYTIDVKII